MKRPFFVFFLLLALVARVAAGEPVDLGFNLSYLRVHSLSDSSADLQAALAARKPLVIDLRYSTASPGAIGTLQTALVGHPADTALFVLLSPATPASVVDVITHAPGAPLTLGAAGPEFTPKIAVHTDPATDRRAYDAFDAGTPLEKLISGKLDKERFDEATLVKEFKNGNLDAEPPPEPDPSSPKTDATPEKPAPLVDRVLQRAVHLQRALLALRP